MNPPPIQQPQPNWWDRNWKWFVPTGCVSLLVLFTAFIAAIFFLVTGMMKSSDAYKGALAKATAHPTVQRSLGTPIEEGFFIMGNINVSGPSGNADLAIPISGPEGKATIYVAAVKSAGRWNFKTLVVEIKETGKRIDLLE